MCAQVPDLTFRIDIKLNRRVSLRHHRKPLRSLLKSAKGKIIAIKPHSTGAKREPQDVDKSPRQGSGGGREAA
jgi:hypothetical protein